MQYGLVPAQERRAGITFELTFPLTQILTPAVAALFSYQGTSHTIAAASSAQTWCGTQTNVNVIVLMIASIRHQVSLHTASHSGHTHTRGFIFSFTTCSPLQTYCPHSLSTSHSSRVHVERILDLFHKKYNFISTLLKFQTVLPL